MHVLGQLVFFASLASAAAVDIAGAIATVASSRRFFILIADLVALALGWLGWKVASQERALERQRQRERLDQAADSIAASTLRKLAEIEAGVAQADDRAAAALVDTTGARPVRIRFDSAAVHIDPPHVLLYLPFIPSRQLDDGEFRDADRLEFLERDDVALTRVLRRLADSGTVEVRAEALIRLARMQSRQGRISDALDTYARVREPPAISPQLEVPYALVAGFARCQLLLRVPEQGAALNSELIETRRRLRSGVWPIRKASFVYYDSMLRQMANSDGSDDPTPAQFALADAVSRLWDDWRAQHETGQRPAGRWVHGSGETAMVAVVSANAERLDAAIFTPERIGQLVLDAASTMANSAFP
jgi:hypothetical protein